MDQDPSQPPARLPLDPQTSRVVLVGCALLVVLIGVDTALELTGHGESPIAGVVTKLLTAVVGVATAYLAGRSPGPEHAQMRARIEYLERRSSPPEA
jgi:hypothetical protein